MLPVLTIYYSRKEFPSQLRTYFVLQNGFVNLKAGRLGDQLTITAPRSFMNGPSCLPAGLPCMPPIGGDTKEQPLTPTTPHSKHIALHLLSKLLDDESITSVDESSGLEPFPGTPTFVQDQGSVKATFYFYCT